MSSTTRLALLSPALLDIATDVEVAQNVLAALLEPPLTGTGSGWTGTGQFTFAQLQIALQNRLNRFIGEIGPPRCTDYNQRVRPA